MRHGNVWLARQSLDDLGGFVGGVREYSLGSEIV